MNEDRFATTRWTMVMAAGRSGGGAEKALGDLCQAYWFPLYAYVRRRGYAKEDAEDLTQSFFADLLGRKSFAELNDGQGRFRAFLLAALKHFLANEWDKATARKRGGSITHLSLDWQSADMRFEIADHEGMTPDREFDREWALTLLARVLAALGEEFSRVGTAGEFEVLKPYLTTGKGEIAYDDAAARLGMDAGALRVRVHRLRKRYRELLKQEIAGTLDNPAIVDEELRALMGAFD